MNNYFKKGIYVNYVVQILNFCGHLTSKLWPSSVSGNWDKFREISEFIPGNSFLNCGNTAITSHACMSYQIFRPNSGKFFFFFCLHYEKDYRISSKRGDNAEIFLIDNNSCNVGKNIKHVGKSHIFIINPVGKNISILLQDYFPGIFFLSAWREDYNISSKRSVNHEIF